MPRSIKNAMSDVSAASNAVDNAADWVSVIAEKVNVVVDKMIADGGIDLEISGPINIFGKTVELTGNVKIKFPE